MRRGVGVYKQTKRSYSERPPYFPPVIFEEYPFEDLRTDRGNEAYASFRQLLRLLGLDSGNFGKRRWDPFGLFISPGQTVLLKPNFVKHFSERHGVKGLITHGSIIRAVADYVYIALKGKGRIIIADGPMDDADFEKIAELTGLYEIKRFYAGMTGFNIEIYDLRQEMVIKKKGRIIQRTKLQGDPAGYTAIDLAEMSEFKRSALDYRSFKGAESDADIMYLHHNETKDEYLISNTFLRSDVVINIAKMKTHRRAGVTLSLKNLIGITGDRNWLPHFCNNGSGNHNEDYDSDVKNLDNKIFRIIKRPLAVLAKPLRDRLRQYVGVTRSTIENGNWYGNDIMWRTIIDLAHINDYADKRGVIKKERQRKSFAIIDGIVAGEGDGPLNPRPKACGLLIGGFNYLCVDAVTSRLMGFEPMKIPKFKRVSNEIWRRICGIDLRDIMCLSNVEYWNKALGDLKDGHLIFKPHYGWKRHIEVDGV